MRPALSFFGGVVGRGPSCLSDDSLVAPKLYSPARTKSSFCRYHFSREKSQAAPTLQEISDSERRKAFCSDAQDEKGSDEKLWRIPRPLDSRLVAEAEAHHVVAHRSVAGAHARFNRRHVAHFRQSLR